MSLIFNFIVGVRKGGVLSPLFFAIFIDQLVDKVESANAGCYVSTVCCSIFLYADDAYCLWLTSYIGCMRIRTN